MFGMRKERLADAGLVYCALVWGATFYMVKDALAGAGASALVAWRFLLSALFLAPWALKAARPSRHLREAFWLSLLLTGLYLSQTYGLLWTSASNSGFITGLFILFVPLFLWLLLRQPPAAGQWVAVGLAMAGLWLLTGGLHGFNQGDALTLITAATYAGHLLATDRLVRGDADPMLLAFHQFWMTGLMCLAGAMAAGESMTVSRPAAAAILFLALFPTLSGFFLQMWAQRFVAPLRVALIFSLEPVFAAIFAWTLGGETFRREALAGGLLIVAAMVASELSKLDFSKKTLEKEVLPV
jgi:drug/metabolite transporter (DMT)-like permease